MKKAIAFLLLVTIAVLPFTFITHADTLDGSPDTIGDFGGGWTYEDSVFTCTERIGWPDFGYYQLGVTAEKIKLYAEITVADKKLEPDGLGGDSGFMVGVTDKNGNGVIEEGKDEYYLIDVSCGNDGGFIAIEKNVAKWGDWAAIDHSYGFTAGDKVGLCLIYDPQTAHFEVYITEIVDGVRMTDLDPVIDWTDTKNPLTGIGFGLCSKITNGTFENVSYAFGGDATPPAERGYEPGEHITGNTVLLADFSDPDFVGKMYGKGNDCDLEYDERYQCMKITVTGRDPFFQVPMNMSKYFDGDVYHNIIITYMTEEDSQGEVFFTSTYSRENIQRNHIFYYMEPAEEFTELEIDMTYDDYGNWTDEIRTIRIDPNHNGEEGQIYFFKSVKAKSDAEDIETELQTEIQTEPVTEPQTELQTESETQIQTEKATEEQKNQTEAKQEDKGKDGSNTGLIVAIIAASAAVVIVLAVVLILKKKK